MRAAAVAAFMASASSLTVHAPEELIGDYEDAPPDKLSPSRYSVSANLAIAVKCPCDWATPLHDGALLEGRILLIPDQMCPATCSVASAICAASRANASGLLLSCQFSSRLNAHDGGTAEIVDDRVLQAKIPEKPSDCHNSMNAIAPNFTSCPALPTIFVMSNVSKTFAAYAIEANGSSIDPNATTLYMPNIVASPINLTFSRGESDTLDCTVYEYVPLVYLLLVPIWWLLTVLWTWNTYRANVASARDLHRLLCWVPVIQFVHGILSLFNYSSCPWEGTVTLVYATFWAVITILKEPVMLLCLLLVAKGWCITRNSLHRREVCVAGTIVALLYAAVSVQLSLQSAVSLAPMVLMYLAILGDVALSILSNLRILKAQLLALHSFGIDPRTTPVHRKYRMFVSLAKFTSLFVLLEAAIHIAFTDQSFYWLFVLLHQTMELVIAIGIGYTFRAQPFNVLFQQVQQVATELADQLLPSITTVELKPGVFNGSNLIAWRASLDLNSPASALPTTLVVLNPGDEEMPQSSATQVPHTPPQAQLATDASATSTDEHGHAIPLSPRVSPSSSRPSDEAAERESSSAGRRIASGLTRVVPRVMPVRTCRGAPTAAPACADQGVNIEANGHGAIVSTQAEVGAPQCSQPAEMAQLQAAQHNSVTDHEVPDEALAAARVNAG
eukprot:CAMPEP_0119313406 /NCGR_PEP_ID=MMETSP1333-20130426/28978_1 /TAXON_ID=418940 /ORGANISM="Scyphosphaera apsteinii, Strain RCC1455" /LENGTH=671 /DNA_ID=CAMNT_0007318237 /DNA_START=28 /DNA_END=2043 /DNA_ORIENTATION=-